MRERKERLRETGRKEIKLWLLSMWVHKGPYNRKAGGSESERKCNDKQKGKREVKMSHYWL